MDLSNADSIYLFNPASSPFQNKDTLANRANDDRYTYFINPSDMVSDGLFQQMDWGKVNNSYIGEFNFSPLTAHSMDQWYPSYGGDDHVSYNLTPEEQEKTDAMRITRTNKQDKLLEKLNIDRAVKIERDD